jgi:hypothetical protein
MDPTYLNRIEKGKRPPPGIKKVLSILQALRLSRAQTNDMMMAAGFEPTIVELSGGLSYSSPSMETAVALWGSNQRLHAAIDAFLEELEPRDRQLLTDAILTLLEVRLPQHARSFPNL